MKPITKVFIIIGTLLLSLILWSLIFNDGGVLRIAWNSLAGPVNNAYNNIVGGGGESRILPMWGGASNADRGDNADADTHDAANFQEGVDNVGGGTP